MFLGSANDCWVKAQHCEHPRRVPVQMLWWSASSSWDSMFVDSRREGFLWGPVSLSRLMAVGPGLLCVASEGARMNVSTAQPRLRYISCTLCCKLIGWLPGSKSTSSITCFHQLGFNDFGCQCPRQQSTPLAHYNSKQMAGLFTYSSNCCCALVFRSLKMIIGRDYSRTYIPFVSRQID